MKAGLGMLASFNAWVKGRPVPPISWTRHGPLPVLFDLPFLKLGKLVVHPDFGLSLQPLFFTAALLTVVYLWLTRLCTPGMSLLLTLIGAFGTMLWPYAYIGLEPKQSFFILLAGYLGLAKGKLSTWPGLLLFSVTCGVAISTKATGIVLGPAIAYLVYVQFRSDWRSRLKQVATVCFVISGTWVLSTVGWSLFWGGIGGGMSSLQRWIIDSPFQFFTNLLGLFGSPGKGLFVFAPVLLIGVYAVPHAFRLHPETTVFAFLVTICTGGFLSMLTTPADELWGPRFMHVTVAPLLIVIGAACHRFRWRRDVPLLLFGVVGIGISFLGAFYYYGARGWAAEAAGQNTLEWFAGDSVWNEVRFDARLFNVWWKGGTGPVRWTPEHRWVWTPPADAQPWKTVNLRDYADPQSFLLYYWKAPLEGQARTIFRICLISLVLGPLLLLWVIANTIGGTVKALEAAPMFTFFKRPRV
jgi:hypothetical protein